MNYPQTQEKLGTKVTERRPTKQKTQRRKLE